MLLNGNALLDKQKVYLVCVKNYSRYIYSTINRLQSLAYLCPFDDYCLVLLQVVPLGLLFLSTFEQIELSKPSPGYS